MGKNLKDMQNYANAIYQNAMVGVQSVRDIEDKVENENLKKEILCEAEKFNEIADKVKIFVEKKGFEVKENNFFEKSRLWATINMSTMFDNSTRHIAEMMLLGTVMGLVTCYKDKYDHKNVSEDLDKILLELEETEDENYLRLKKFLKSL